jgi:hypothetical protein
LPAGPEVPGRMRKQPPASRGSQVPQAHAAEQRSTPHASPFEQARDAPGVHTPPPPEHAPQGPHAPQRHDAPSQLRMLCWVPPHAPGQLCMRVSVAPGAHSDDAPPHAPNAPYAPHRQSIPQVRERDCVPLPHAPHAWLSDSLAPTAHSPSPPHVNAPQVQSAPQTRERVPQLPQLPPLRSVAPGVHSEATQSPTTRVASGSDIAPVSGVTMGIPVSVPTGRGASLMRASMLAGPPSVGPVRPSAQPAAQRSKAANVAGTKRMDALKHTIMRAEQSLHHSSA